MRSLIGLLPEILTHFALNRGIPVCFEEIPAFVWLKHGADVL